MALSCCPEVALETLAIDVGSQHVGLCRWGARGLHLLRLPTESPVDAWPRWIEALAPTLPYEVIYRCTHPAIRDRHEPRAIAELADRCGARQLRTIADDLHADPASAAARYVARLHRLPIICCAEAGAVTLTAVVQDPRGTVSAFRRFRIESTSREVSGEVARWLKAALAAAVKESGLDRADNVPLICFGGRGPSIAAQLADGCGLASFLIPPHAGLFSTIGMFMSDIVLNFEHNLHATDIDIDQLRQAFGTLMDRASNAITMEGYDLDDAVCLRIAQMAYAGDDSVEVDCDDLADAPRLVARFRAMCSENERDAEGSRSIEVRTIRVKAVIETRTADMLPAGSVLHSPKGTTQPDSNRGFTPPADATVHLRHELIADTKIEGPACVREQYATTSVPRGWVAQRTVAGSLLVRRHRSAADVE